MILKNLLLGSAAALVAVSGARAADAIVAAEPEAVEYVRVCDAFGTGYFYIPGTETCLKIGGYLRYDIGFGEAPLYFARTSVTGDDTWFKQARASFQVSTASETELGTLRTYIETRWQFSTNDAAVLPGYSTDHEFSINFAWLQLGGLRIGKDESFFTTWTGYAGAVIIDDATGGYGPFDTNLISYTYEGESFRAGIALEQGDDSAAATDWGIDDYMPHVVAGIGASFGMVDLSAVFGYDTRDDIGLVARGGWAAKIRADVKINDAASVFAMVMYGEDESGYTTWSNGVAGDETLSVIAGGSYAFTDKATFNVQGQWIDGTNGLDDRWSLVGNVAYELVPGLTITPEVVYVDDGVDDAIGGYLRFQRDF